MKTVLCCALALCLHPLASRAADEFQAMNVKPGLWETTMSTQMSGLPPIPPEALARLTPEQRKQMESVLSQRAGRGTATTTKACVAKEDMNKPLGLNDTVKQNCKSTIVRSSGTEQEIRLECNQGAMQGTATVHIEAVDSENIKGTMQMNANGGNNKMSMQSSFTSKWIGSDCGNLKKAQ
jgi:uncharacterized protein DUF3617